MSNNPMVLPRYDLNQAIRQTGNRGRTLPTPPLPNIGQNAPPATPPLPPAPTPAGTPPMMPQPVQSGFQQPPRMSPAAAPQIPQNPQPNPFVLHPPGTQADSTHYNYEPQQDGSWRVYPPGVQAPANNFQTSMPRAASTADYSRMSRALGQAMQQRQQGF